MGQSEYSVCTVLAWHERHAFYWALSQLATGRWRSSLGPSFLSRQGRLVGDGQIIDGRGKIGMCKVECAMPAWDWGRLRTIYLNTSVLSAASLHSLSTSHSLLQRRPKKKKKKGKKENFPPTGLTHVWTFQQLGLLVKSGRFLPICQSVSQPQSSLSARAPTGEQKPGTYQTCRPADLASTGLDRRSGTERSVCGPRQKVPGPRPTACLLTRLLCTRPDLPCLTPYSFRPTDYNHSPCSHVRFTDYHAATHSHFVPGLGQPWDLRAAAAPCHCN